jgi:hypothetical protein
MSKVLITQIVVAVAIVGGLGAFLHLIAVPAIAAREGSWQRLLTALLSIYTLGVLVAVGVAAGIGVIWVWPRLF